MRLAACALALVSAVAEGAALQVVERIPSSGEIRGAARSRDGRLFTWGDSLRVRDAHLKSVRTLARGPFAEGGCLVDLDGDGKEEFVGQEGLGLGPLTWRKAPAWKPIVLEKETDTHDCIEATLFGRKGVLAIHRHTQVRFYELPADLSKPWEVREVYSIYTPSQQSGLSLRDVDGDGRTDILCGNYWIQSPASFELPWHIFAINTWFEASRSALLQHATVGQDLIMVQAHMSPSRVAIFRKPSDVRQLWNASPIEGEFHNVHAIAQAEGGVFVAENNGRASRIFEVTGNKVIELAAGSPSLGLFPTPEALISVGPHEIVVWVQRRK
jgi:hypothetical protein